MRNGFYKILANGYTNRYTKNCKSVLTFDKHSGRKTN